MSSSASLEKSEASKSLTPEDTVDEIQKRKPKVESLSDKRLIKKIKLGEEVTRTDRLNLKILRRR